MNRLLLGIAWMFPVVLLLLRRFTTPAAEGTGTHEQLGLAACRFRELAGFVCPGCGVTTSVSHFVHGAPLESLRVQPLGFAIAVVALLLPIGATWHVVRGGDLGRNLEGGIGARFVIAGGVVVVGSWIYKLTIT